MQDGRRRRIHLAMFVHGVELIRCVREFPVGQCFRENLNFLMKLNNTNGQNIYGIFLHLPSSILALSIVHTRAEYAT